LIRRGEKVIGVRTEQGSCEGDSILVTTGAWSRPFRREYGYKAPIEPGMAYSITISSPRAQLKHPTTLDDRITVLSPDKESVRVGGTMELSGLNSTIVRKRIQLAHAAVQRYFPQGLGGYVSEEWVGMRPMTPDDLPIMGLVPGWENLYISSGHGMN